jgi:hypothetical protein
MLSQFECIGLDIKDTRAFENIIDLVFTNGRRLLTPKGTYYACSLGQEIDLWATSMSEDETWGPIPHVRTASHITVSLTRRFPDKTLPLEGCFEAWPNPRIIMFSHPPQASGSYPITFRCPGFRWYDHLWLPALAQVQLVGFPISVEIDKKMEHDPIHIEGLRWDDEYLIPSGTFVAAGRHPAPIVDLGGVIIAQRMIFNTLASTFVYLATVRTYEMDLDVLLPLPMVEKTLEVGQTIRGRFLLSGIITDLTYPFGVSNEDQLYTPFMDISITVNPIQSAEMAAMRMLYGDLVTLSLKIPQSKSPASIVIRTLRGQRLGSIPLESFPNLSTILQAGITPAAWVINKHIREPDEELYMDLDIRIALPPGTQPA